MRSVLSKGKKDPASGCQFWYTNDGRDDVGKVARAMTRHSSAIRQGQSSRLLALSTAVIYNGSGETFDHVALPDHGGDNHGACRDEHDRPSECTRRRSARQGGDDGVSRSVA